MKYKSTFVSPCSYTENSGGDNLQKLHTSFSHAKTDVSNQTLKDCAENIMITTIILAGL